MRFPGGSFATRGNKALFQPGALVMQVVVGSCLHHVMVGGDHKWCRKLQSLADRPGGEPRTCHLGRPQHQSEPESECTGNRPRQDISWKSRYFQPAIEIMFQYGRSCLFVFVWTMSNGQFPLDMYEHACTCVKENLDVFATCL